jgi:hypothetical protein
MNMMQTGVMMSAEEVMRAAELCEAAGTWLVLDNTYEDFVFEGRSHFCLGGNNVLNIFSFSKVRPWVCCGACSMARLHMECLVLSGLVVKTSMSHNCSLTPAR